MKARYVELISTVADAGSLGAAAIRLGKSRPAISKALNAAEHEIGCQIFQRGPRVLCRQSKDNVSSSAVR